MYTDENDQKCGVVVLNYLAYEETVTCVRSLLQQNVDQLVVVIVNNNAPDASMKYLTRIFENHNNVIILSTGQNLGFARGHNFGIQYLRDHGVYDILALNSDVVINDQYYLSKLLDFDYPKDCAMVGTRIVNGDGFDQNVMNSPITRNFQVAVTIARHLAKYLQLVFRRKEQVADAETYRSDSPIPSVPMALDPTNQYLHGAAIYFREPYLKKFIGFFPETFLYGEENLLSAICLKLGFQQYFRSDLTLTHKGAGSTGHNSASNRKNQIVRIKESVRSNLVLLRVLNMKNSKLIRIMTGAPRNRTPNRVAATV